MPGIAAARIAAVALLALTANADTGSPLVRAYTPKVYRASPQNWSVVQDSSGILYVGNTDGVLEFDGVAWRKIIVGSNTGVRALAVDSNNRVFVGAQGDFGYLATDAAGTTSFHSLRHLVPKDTGKFSDVWSVIPTAKGIFFGSYQAIFRWSGNSLRVWKPRTRFGRLIESAGLLYVAAEGEGLLRLDGETLQPVAGTSEIRPAELRSIVARSDGLLLVTRKALLVLRDDHLSPLPVNDAQLIAEGSFYSATPLRDGSVALATTLRGVAFVRPDGSILRQLTRENGLAANGATSLAEDREGGLWITSGAGLDRADMAIARFAQAEGIGGATYVLVRHQGLLYAGTTQGLFALTDTGFAPVKGINETVISAVSTQRGLVVGTQRALHLVNGLAASQIRLTPSPYDSTASARDRDLVYVAGSEGLVSYRWRSNAWKQDRLFPSGGEDFRSVLEDGDGRIWVATAKDILRVDWRKPESTVQRFGPEAGVPAGFKNVFRVRGVVVFATPKGILRFDDATSKFLPFDHFGREFADGSHVISLIREAPDGAIWITGEGYHSELRPSAKGWTTRSMPLGRADLAELYALLPEADGTVWAAGTDGVLFRYSPKNQPPPAPFGVLVRRAQPRDGEPAAFGAKLPHAQNSLRFELAAPYLQDPGKVEYRTLLVGMETVWTPWTTETFRDFTSLWEGNYKLRVQARNPAGVVSREAFFAFSIAPPWFRTWPAYLLYVIAIGASFWGILRWRVRKLEAEKAKLEQTVEERTVEIREQRDEIQREQEKSQTLLLNILPESVARELKETGIVEPQNYDQVTVCFTDFAGFTLSSESLPASHLVSALHEYFTTFDEIVDEFGLEKLKTIGDAYMLVSGLPRPHKAHAVDAVLAALRMVDAVAELANRGDGPVWQVRIGLHSGAVAAGVVGVRKFAFDIWGNTVNLASRMESSGAVGRVNISEDTLALIDEFIEVEARGAVQTKDKRDLRMYFALGLRSGLSEPGAFVDLYRRRFGTEPSYQVPSAPKVVI